MSKKYTDADAKRLGLLDPTSTPVGTRAQATIPVLETLTGKRIGLLDNSKTHAAALLARIGHALTHDYGAANVLGRTKLIYSRVAPPELIEELAGNCDAVITAIGD